MGSTLEHLVRMYLFIMITGGLGLMAGVLVENYIAPLYPLLHAYNIEDILGYETVKITWSHIYVPMAILLGFMHWFLGTTSEILNEEAREEERV